MHINGEQILGAVVAAYFFARKWYAKISNAVSPLIEEVEKRAQDGVIDKKDRKEIVMQAIASLRAQGKLKLNFLDMLIVSKLVDILAKNLPDFQISKEAQAVIAEASKEIK